MKLRLYVDDDNEIGEPFLMGAVEATEFEEAYEERLDQVLEAFAEEVVATHGEDACERLMMALQVAVKRIDDLIATEQYHEAMSKGD